MTAEERGQGPADCAPSGRPRIAIETPDLVAAMRSRCCNLAPWPSDHGHTDCHLYGAAAFRIEYLENQVAYLREQCRIRDAVIRRKGFQ